MKIKKILCGFLGLLSIGLLAGCGNNEDSSKNSSLSVDDNASQTGEINIVKNDNLAVDQNKCVGCGKCARIAPANFEMNTATRKAQIKSSEISNQVAIDRANGACHVGAISQ